MSISPKIQCFGIKPKKSEVYLLAAELVELEGIVGFREAIIKALKSYDYYDYNYDYNHNYNDYDHDYDYDYYYDYYFDFDYYYDFDLDFDLDLDFSNSEKVIALLFLSAMYESEGK